MKGLKISFIVLAAALITVGLSGGAFAFHSGGVAECMGCHNIHDAASASGLLIKSDVSSTCLVCHGKTGASSYHIATPDADMGTGTPPGNRTPGGDFGWLKKTYTWVPRGTTVETSEGDRHGHNIVAADYESGYDADATNLTAPGGDMDATDFSCNSCHDQHGKLRRLSDGTFDTTGAPIVGSGSYSGTVPPVPSSGQALGTYRLLRGPGSGAGDGGKTFSSTFHALSPSTYNRTEATIQTRVGYGAGVSDWCAACHPDMHSGTSSKMTHVVNQNLGATVTPIYNAYRGSGNMVTSGDGTSYDSLVPFQHNNSSDYTLLNSKTTLVTGSGSSAVTTTPTDGPATSDRVMCLSCHRAHASGWDFMTRWNATGNEFIAVDGVWPGTNSPSTIASAAKYAQGRTIAETSKAYNDRAMGYASYQRSLCNKCHAKD